MIEDTQADSSVSQVGAELDEVEHGTPEPVETGDHQGVPGADQFQDEVEFGA